MNALIAYFSCTGHTKGIAQQMRDITGGRLFEIRPTTPYNQDYDTAKRQGRKETHDGYRPPLAEQAGLSACGTILLGTPNWANLQHSSIVAVKKRNAGGSSPPSAANRDTLLRLRCFWCSVPISTVHPMTTIPKSRKCCGGKALLIRHKENAANKAS